MRSHLHPKTSQQKKRKLMTYARRRSSSSSIHRHVDVFAEEDEQPLVSPRYSQPSSPSPHNTNASAPSTPRYIPPHLQQEVGSQKSTGYREGSPTFGRGTPAFKSTIASNDSSSATTINSSDVSLDSANFSDLRNMTMNGNVRPSSPAKRSASEREKNEIEASHEVFDGENTSPRQSKPASLLSHSQITSPLPSRSKHVPMDIDGSYVDNGKAAHTVVNNHMPSIDDQVKQVLPLIQNQELREGSKAYLVPMSWLNRVLSRSTEGLKSSDYPKESREGSVGPVDTRGLLPPSATSDLEDFRDGFGNRVIPLRSDLQSNEDYEFFPPQAWNLVLGWYGLAQGAPTIERYARDTTLGGEAPYYQYELNPPFVTVQKIVKKHERGLDTIGDEGKPAARLVASRVEKYQSFLKRVKQAAGIDVATKVNVWRIVEMESTGMPTPKPSPDSSPSPQAAPAANTMKLVISEDALERLPFGKNKELLDFKDETANEKYNGSITLASVGFYAVQTLVLEQQDNSSMKHSNTASRAESIPRETTMNGIASGNSQGGLRSTTPAKNPQQNAPSVLTRGRLNKKGKTKGTAGLTNLGNTCYMNSAVQCLRSIEELTVYFLEQQHKTEINFDNPLGHKGHVANAYASLVHNLYNVENGFAPRAFKSTISREYPTFSGYGQQDSQEFVSSLLDGLHEDLNRIHKKPYIENPDSDDKTVGDADAIRLLGEKYRENFRKRNESVVVDLFNGWYKNTLVCPVCAKVSITFDPFSQVTLQLPVENTFQHQVTLFPLQDSPRLIDIDIDKNSTIKALKEYCAQRVKGIKPENLVLAEEYNHKFYKLFEDADVLSESQIQKNDKLNMYELDDAPTNWPPLDKKKPKRNFFAINAIADNFTALPNMTSPTADRMAVPVYNRFNKNSRFPMTELHPFFILITREETKDTECVLRKILQKVETMTTRNLFDDSDGSTSQRDEPDQQENPDSRRVDDSKVEMHSTDGEEDFVDVSLTKPQDNAQPAASTSTSTSRSSAKVLDRSFFIMPEYRNAFDICVYTNTQDVIPSGFSTISESQRYPKITERVQPSLHRRPSTSSWASRSNSRRRGWNPRESDSDSGSEDELAQSQHSLADPAASTNGDSEDDGDTSMNEQSLSPRQKASRSHRWKQGLKGTFKNMRRSKSRSQEYILKLGEGLVLDWQPDQYDQFFGGDDPGDWKGRRTDLEVPIVPDPELDTKRERRAARRKAGASLDDCLDETANSEVLSEDNAWYCSRCKELRRATKTLELWAVPDVLVVHLKRFGSGGRFGRDKVDLLVDFPIEGLDLNGRVGLPEGKSLVYDLFAVDNHMGGLGGGHYTAHAKNFIDGNWYEYNDTFVSRASPESSITRSAYLLFYRRRSNRPLGSPRLQEIVTKAIDSSSSSSFDRDPGQTESSSEETSASDSIIGAGGLKGGSGGMQGGSGALSQDEPIDEGIGDMDDDPDNPLPGIEDRQSKPLWHGSTWSFNNVGASAPTNSDNGLADSETLNDDVNASDKPDQGSDLEDRMKDFAEGYGSSEIAPILSGHNGELEHIPMDGFQRGRSADDEVAEIRVTDEDEKMVT